MDLEFDIKGWLRDNPDALKEGDATLQFGEGAQYAEKLPVTPGESEWIVPGHTGLSIGRYWNGEYWTGFSSEGICELDSHISAGDDGDTVDVEGTIYFPAGAEVMLCVNPVYMTESGEYYLTQGSHFQSSLESGSMSQSVKDEKTWTVNGEQTTYCAEFAATVQGVTPAQTVRLVWMSADHAELARTEYPAEAMPQSVTPADGAAYLIAEEIAGKTITRTLYQPGDDPIRIFFREEQVYCLPRFTEILWEM